jgi:hypothetical protein
MVLCPPAPFGPMPRPKGREPIGGRGAKGPDAANGTVATAAGAERLYVPDR